MKCFKLFSFILVIAIGVLTSNLFAEDLSDVWVAVTVFDGRNIGTTPEYYGKMSRTTYNQLTSKLEEGRMFNLKSVFWTDDSGNVIYMSDAQKHGRSYGYTNDVYFRADHIFRIVRIKNEFINKLLQ